MNAVTGPLSGWRVIVTRARSQASGLVQRLTDAGARVVELPVIEIVEASDGGAALSGALARIKQYEWVVFTSANAVERCWPHPRDAPALAGVKIAAVGESTAASLSDRGIIADLVPDRFVAESLVDAFPSPLRAGEAEGTAPQASVLLPSAADARDVLAEGLRAKGWRVDVVEAYRTVRPAHREGSGSAQGLEGADAITFTSSSTVTGFLEVAGPDRVPPVVACIGPITARTATEAGLKVDLVAPVHTVDGLVDGLIEWARHKGSAGDRQ